jgi:hypothetical protein
MGRSIRAVGCIERFYEREVKKKTSPDLAVIPFFSSTASPRFAWNLSSFPSSPNASRAFPRASPHTHISFFLFNPLAGLSFHCLSDLFLAFKALALSCQP